MAKCNSTHPGYVSFDVVDGAVVALDVGEAGIAHNALHKHRQLARDQRVLRMLHEQHRLVDFSCRGRRGRRRRSGIVVVVVVDHRRDDFGEFLLLFRVETHFSVIAMSHTKES